MIKLSLDALQVLDAIARRGSFGAAGEELHRAASTLSYTVQKLEDDLGIQVFDRSGHRAVLTVAGRALLEEGRHLLENAAAVERRIRGLASGWEPELTIACDELVGAVALYPLLEAFYAEGHPTRIRITSEVLSGAWDALIARRAALAIAQEGLAPLVGIVTRPLGRVAMAFVCAPGHALARAREPLRMEQIERCRRVATADTSRSLPPRSSGMLGADDTLTVPNMQSKIEAHIAGLGVGFVPRALAADAIRRGRLVEKRVVGHERGSSLCAAWRPREAGPALDWFLGRLNDAAVRRRLTGAPPD